MAGNNIKIHMIGRLVRLFSDVRLIVFLAVAVRLAVRIFKTTLHLRDGYPFYYYMARRLLNGEGLYWHHYGIKYMDRDPLYPLILAGIQYLFGESLIGLYIVQSILAGLIVYLVYWLGRELFGDREAALAAWITALYPYYVAHDTAIQNTVLYTLLSLGLTCLAFSIARSPLYRKFALAGLLAGLAVMNRSTILLMLPLLLIWLLLNVENKRRVIAGFAIVCLVLGITMTPWFARNYAISGRIVLNTFGGRSLWIGNNPHTLTNYPSTTIDRSEEVAWNSLPREMREHILSLDEVAQDNFFKDMGKQWIRNNPGQFVRYALIKVGAGFSVRRGHGSSSPLARISYALSWGPVLVLGLLGMALAARRSWRRDCLFYFHFLAFLAPTAVFWAHASHRSYLDVYLILFASYVLIKIFSRRKDDLQGSLHANGSGPGA